MNIVSYYLDDTNKAREDSEAISSFHFNELVFKNIVANHFASHHIKWTYTDEFWHEEEYYRRATSLQDFQHRLSNKGKLSKILKKEWEEISKV